MQPFEVLQFVQERFSGKGPQLGHFIGDFDEPHNTQTYGSAGDSPSNMNQILFGDVVRIVAEDLPGYDDTANNEKAKRMVQAAMAILRQAEYTKQDVSLFNRDDVASTITQFANSNARMGELVYNGAGILDGHANMKQKVSTGAYAKKETQAEALAKVRKTDPLPDPTSETDKFKKAAKTKADAAKAKADADAAMLLAGTGKPGDPLAVQPVKPAPKPGDSPMLEWTAEQKAAGNLSSQAATDPYGNIPGAEAAYGALSPRQIAAGLPTTMEGGFSPFAQQTYRRMLTPLAQENGVFDFLSIAGIAPRMAMPGDPTTVNPALSFRAFLSQDPSVITQNISEGLGILESAKLKASTNMQGFIAGVGSTDQERAVYNAFLQDPSAEFDLRSSLADRAYPGVVGDAIKGALSAQYYSTLSTNPIALSQPGFYKNAFKNYMPTGVMTNFVSSAGQELDENTANAVETAAANTVVADGTKDDKVNIEPNQIEKTVESVVNKFDPYVSPQMIADAAKEGTITSAASKATAPATAPVTAPKPTPAPAPAIIDKGVSGLYDIEGWGAPGGSQSPVIPGSVGGGDPSGSIWNPDSPTLAPTIPATQGLGASLGGEMLGYEDPRSLYTGRDRAYAQLFSPNAMQPGANITSPVAPVDTGTPMLDDMGMIAPPATTAPSGVSEMEPGRMDQWRLDDTVRDMDAVNYGITNQAPYKPTGMADYYTEVRDPSEMFDVHSDPAYPNPDAQFLRQYPYSPPATPPGGINMYSPVPVPQVTPGPTGSERLGTPTQPLTGPSNPPGWPGAPPISLDMGGEYGTGVEPIRTHPLEGEFDNALARLGIGGAGRLFRDYLKQGWGIESEMDIQNFMKTPAGMNAFRSFNQPTATNAGFGGSGGIG